MATITIDLEFSGGMELLFSHQTNHTITIPRYYTPSSISPDHPVPTTPPPPQDEGELTNVRYLVWWLREFLLADKGRPELFSQGESVRPGILVLINDADWELEQELDTVLQDKDVIVFISTLHGG